jgi:hypothetical protein
LAHVLRSLMVLCSVDSSMPPQYPGEAEVLFAPLTGMEPQGEPWARSHCPFALLFIHFIPDLLRYSVPLFLNRQCDRTLGESLIYANGNTIRHMKFRPTVNQRAVLIEQLVEQRKILHLECVKNLRSELKSSMIPVELLERFDMHYEAVQNIKAELFNTDLFYRVAVEVAIDLKHALSQLAEVVRRVEQDVEEQPLVGDSRKELLEYLFGGIEDLVELGGMGRAHLAAKSDKHALSGHLATGHADSIEADSGMDFAAIQNMASKKAKELKARADTAIEATKAWASLDELQVHKLQDLAGSLHQHTRAPSFVKASSQYLMARKKSVVGIKLGNALRTLSHDHAALPRGKDAHGTGVGETHRHSGATSTLIAMLKLGVGRSLRKLVHSDGNSLTKMMQVRDKALNRGNRSLSSKVCIPHTNSAIYLVCIF